MGSLDNVRRLATMLHLLIQLAAIVNFAYTIYWDLYILKLPGRPSFGGQWKYLTFINLWIQLIYFSVSFFNNFIGSQATDSTKASKLQKCRDYLFATLAFPIGQFVGIIFWVLFHIDRELVFLYITIISFPITSITPCTPLSYQPNFWNCSYSIMRTQ